MASKFLSVIVRTDTSAVVRGYPWTNGVPLADDRRALMEKWLEGTKQHNVFVHMALVSSQLQV
jgi:hypothetical protein